MEASSQKKITAYVNGHYPDVAKGGYSVQVLEIRQRVILGFNYPGNEGYPSYHPLWTELFDAEMTKLLNDNGYAGKPLWASQSKSISAEQLEKLYQQK